MLWTDIHGRQLLDKFAILIRLAARVFKNLCDTIFWSLFITSIKKTSFTSRIPDAKARDAHT